MLYKNPKLKLMKIFFITTCLFFSLNIWAQVCIVEKTSHWIIGSDFNFSINKNIEALILNEGLFLPSDQNINRDDILANSFRIAPYIGKKLKPIF